MANPMGKSVTVRHINFCCSFLLLKKKEKKYQKMYQLFTLILKFSLSTGSTALKSSLSVFHFWFSRRRKKIRVSYFKFKAHVLKPTGRQAINQAFHKLMIITFQTRMSTNVISQEQTVLVVPLICLTIGLGKEPGKNNILCGVVIKLCVLS